MARRRCRHLPPLLQHQLSGHRCSLQRRLQPAAVCPRQHTRSGRCLGRSRRRPLPHSSQLHHRQPSRPLAAGRPLSPLSPQVGSMPAAATAALVWEATSLGCRRPCRLTAGSRHVAARRRQPPTLGPRQQQQRRQQRHQQLHWRLTLPRQRSRSSTLQGTPAPPASQQRRQEAHLVAAAAEVVCLARSLAPLLAAAAAAWAAAGPAGSPLRQSSRRRW